MKKKYLSIALASVCAGSALAFSGCDLGFPTTDYDAWSKNIVEYTLCSSIKVKETEGEDVSQGSGIIFYETEDMYYALTNNHVVYDNGQGHSIAVFNCYDGEHTASIVYQDAAYDLAVLVFNKISVTDQKKANLYVTPLARTNPSGLQPLATVGNPNGKHNATTFGKTLRYEEVAVKGSTLLEESNVQFPALVHDVYTVSGSSGGAIVNERLQLAGIHYACGYSQEDEYVEGYAIPVEKIVEFLKAAETQTGNELGV